ncbi:hypothetical protein SUGI_0519410 [Cryptomeria japonica]|nr:hypothetical protein SUGI_0519410 [Cryptomeria japonica]
MMNLCTTRNATLKDFLVSWPIFNQSKWGALWLVGPAMIVSLIWKEGNKRIFKETSKLVEVVISILKDSIEEAPCGKSKNVRKFRFNDWDLEMEKNWFLKNASFHYPKKKIDRSTYGHIGRGTNNETKFRALEASMLLGKQKGLSYVRVEVDSQIIINGVINSRFTNWKLAKWLPRIHTLLQSIRPYEISHMFREGNQLADLFANLGVMLNVAEVLVDPKSISMETTELSRNDVMERKRDGVG